MDFPPPLRVPCLQNGQGCRPEYGTLHQKQVLCQGWNLMPSTNQTKQRSIARQVQLKSITNGNNITRPKWNMQLPSCLLASIPVSRHLQGEPNSRRYRTELFEPKKLLGLSLLISISEFQSQANKQTMVCSTIETRQTIYNSISGAGGCIHATYSNTFNKSGSLAGWLANLNDTLPKLPPACVLEHMFAFETSPTKISESALCKEG